MDGISHQPDARVLYPDRQLAIRSVAAALCVCCGASWVRAETPQKVTLERPVYHADPQHLWNQLHAALFIRVGPDDRAYGVDRLEPLLWFRSKHLLEKDSHHRAMRVLKEFLSEHGEKLIADPQMRAMLQRDLWLVFNWLEGDHTGFAEPRLDAAQARAAKERLRRPLAAVIGRLALSRQEIANLPDNYAAAVASGRFSRRFDPAQPGKPFLPADLFDADGPWVCVGRSDGRTAPQHLRDDNNRYTNSVFLVFVRLPAGRAATVAFVKQPECFPRILPGTQFALVRRALLVNAAHRVVASPLTESVQLRVIHGDGAASAGQARDGPRQITSGNAPPGGSRQTFQEFRLRRLLLFAGRAGGLQAVGADERDFKTGFVAHPWDEFELRRDVVELEQALGNGQSFMEFVQRLPVTQFCSGCHTDAGVASFRSGFVQDEVPLRPLPIAEMPVAAVADATVQWKEGQANWTALRLLLAE